MMSPSLTKIWVEHSPQQATASTVVAPACTIGLCGYTRARCYSSLKFLVTIGVLHIKEIGEGQ
jgi:hypothetical protein